jgi:hypothetical protein
MSGEQWLGFVGLELEQPANIDVGVGPALGQPREAHNGMQGRAAHVVHLSLEPVLGRLHLHGDTGVAADRELRLGQGSVPVLPEKMASTVHPAPNRPRWCGR